MNHYLHASARRHNNCVPAWFMQKLDDKGFRQSLRSLLAKLKIGGRILLPFPRQEQWVSCRSCLSGPPMNPFPPIVVVENFEIHKSTFVSESLYSVTISLDIIPKTKPCGRTTAPCACDSPVRVTFGW